MANGATLRLSELHEVLRGPVERFAERLQDELGENLRSLSVVGSALAPDFHPERSDINTVLVVARRSHELLKLLAEFVRRGRRDRLDAPMLWTEEYLGQSLDVFAVGMLDFQFNHSTVLGTDPFVDLRFSRADVRHECERELKTMLIGLRQGYVRAAGDLRQVGELLMRSTANLLPPVRAMLWLTGDGRRPEAVATVDTASRRFAFNRTALELPLKLRSEGREPRPEQVDTIFENLYRVVDHLSRTVDRMEADE